MNNVQVGHHSVYGVCEGRAADTVTDSYRAGHRHLHMAPCSNIALLYISRYKYDNTSISETRNVRYGL